MAGNIYQWSTTFASNGTADADVPWPEGMARRQVNDSARGIMGRTREFVTDLGGSIAAGGTANGLTVTAASAFTAYADGQIVSFRATANNTGAATLSVNAIGAKAIRKMDSTGDVALAANDIRNTGLYVAQYSAALNGAAGAWLLVNPTLSAAVYALSGLVTVDNTVPRFNGTAGALQTSGVIIDDSDKVTIAGTPQTSANLKIRAGGNNVEFGHPNTAGFASTLGADVGGGTPFLAFSAEAGTNNNTYRTRGLKGTIIKGDLAGGVIFATVANASADNQTATNRLGITESGYLQSFGDGAGNFIIANDGNNTLRLRAKPLGGGSSDDLVLDNAGNVTINGTLTVTG